MLPEVDTSRANDVRAEVSASYARKAAGTGCGAAHPSAGDARYRPEDVAGVPEDALEHSFGCGNPLAFGQVRAGDVVVDLGCGAGLDLLVAARKVGETGRVIGIDMTDAMIERARENAARAGARNVEVRKGIIEDLPVETASVDWVISNCVVNLSPEKPRVFREIARVLKPGGRMLISDIVVEGAPWWVRRIVATYSASVAGAIGEAAYVSGLERAGLADVKIRNRFVYDAAVVEELMLSEIAETTSGLRRRVLEALIARIARAVAGKVRSIQVEARRA